MHEHFTMSQDRQTYQDSQPQGFNNFNLNPNQTAAMLLSQGNTNSAQGTNNMQTNPMAMLQGNNLGVDQPFNLQNELKRLQQFQQQQQQQQGGNPNALLMTGSQRNNDSNLMFQQMFQQQEKVQNPRFDNALQNNMPSMQGQVSNNPMLQQGLLHNAGFFMSQNQMNPQNLGMANRELPLPSPHSIFHRDGSRRMRGGVIEPFPEKLHRLLLEVEAAGRSDVISFVANGHAFAIHKPDKFFKEIVPLYFRQSRLSSFKRQLNLYGFELINTGPARGGYYHELFVKDRPELCRRMRRTAIKVSSKAEKGEDMLSDKGHSQDKLGFDGDESQPKDLQLEL